MNHKILLTLMCVMVLHISGFSAIISYDGADYATQTDITGLDGESNLWLDSWASAADVDIISGNLDYTNGAQPLVLLAEGNRFECENNVTATRFFETNGWDAILDSNNRFCADGESLWLGFTMVRRDQAIYWSGVVLVEDASDTQFWIGKPWIDALTDGGDHYGMEMNGTDADAGVTCVVDEPVFIAVRIDFASGNETAYMWVNPDLGGIPPADGAADATVSSADFTVDKLFINSGSAGSYKTEYDEVRIGESWIDIAPSIPEPATALVLCSGLLLYLRKK